MYLQSIMSNYLNENIEKNNINNDFSPIKPKKTDWNIEDKRMIKQYTFEDNRFLEQFIIEILKYNRESNTTIETRFFDNIVGIIVRSKSGLITELEIEASRDIDKIKKDVMYYYAE